MPISAERVAILREHVHAESVHDIDALIGGMTPDCFNDIVGAARSASAYFRPRCEPSRAMPRFIAYRRNGSFDS
jgi:hypothetical protein